MSNNIDSKKLRTVAGAFATGVTVITTSKNKNEVHGMTANSFQSVSLDPPLVSFSVKKNGSLMNHLEKGKAVGISILQQNQKDISNKFAGYGDDSTEIRFQKHSEGVSTIEDALAWYTTFIKDIIPAGDHFIILCEVNNLERFDDGKPLLYYSGYRTIGEDI